MSPGDMSKNWQTKLDIGAVAVFAALLLSGCAHGPFANNVADNTAAPTRGVLMSMRAGADPAMVARIRDEEMKEAQKRATQPVMKAETGGAESIQPNLGRKLPGVSIDPISPFKQSSVESMNTRASMVNSANQNQYDNGRSAANRAVPMSTYESSYNAVPPPPAGSWQPDWYRHRQR